LQEPVQPFVVKVSWLAPRDVGCGVDALCTEDTSGDAHVLVYHLAITPLPEQAANALNAMYLLQFSLGINVSAFRPPLLNELSDVAASSTASSHLFTNLSKGRRYWVQVRAENAAALGVSPWSPAILIAGADVPDAPRNVEVFPQGSLSLRVTWLRPVDTGLGDTTNALTGYDLQLRAVNASGMLDDKNPFSSTYRAKEFPNTLLIGDLPLATLLQVRMRSDNGGGRSEWTAWSRAVRPLLLPSVVRNVSLTLKGDAIARLQPLRPWARKVNLELRFSEPAGMPNWPAAEAEAEAEGNTVLKYLIKMTSCPKPFVCPQQPATRYSLYLLYWCKITITDAASARNNLQQVGPYVRMRSLCFRLKQRRRYFRCSFR
jgi:hypothetical protein